GLLTDSLSFQTESTSGKTLRAAASLVDAGAPLSAIAFQLFRQRQRSNAILWGKALGTLQFAVDGRIAWVEVTREMVESSGPGAESGGLSGYAGSIEGVDVGFILEEGQDGNIYVGFRSQSVDVAAVAAEFGGGGHVRAAGCHFKAPATLAEARAQLIPVVERHLVWQGQASLHPRE
ncbi:MAG TPA: DHHA1 domain-containing protein, partial [Chloroflexota bacterium]|nr:DHHA1 domain-containing protein [Chloroflexota bacterium]